MKRDIAQRESLARVDDEEHRDDVTRAREFIYENDYAVNSVAVENLLSEDSYVPTAVRFHSCSGRR